MAVAVLLGLAGALTLVTVTHWEYKESPKVTAAKVLGFTAERIPGVVPDGARVVDTEVQRFLTSTYRLALVDTAGVAPSEAMRRARAMISARRLIVGDARYTGLVQPGWWPDEQGDVIHFLVGADDRWIIMGAAEASDYLLLGYSERQ